MYLIRQYSEPYENKDTKNLYHTAEYVPVRQKKKRTYWPFAR